MSDLRTAAQQALEALEAMQSYAAAERKGLRICDEAIPALRAALAQQAEPVAWRWGYRSVTTGEMDWRGYVEIAAHPNLRSPEIIIEPLYTAPPQRTMVPLTEKEMYAVEEEARKNFRLSQKGPRGQQITYWDGLTPWLIRAVERAHGIKE